MCVKPTDDFLYDNFLEKADTLPPGPVREAALPDTDTETT